jgi:hypothetical protein
MQQDEDPEFNPEELYDQFPNGADNGFGPDEGFNSWVQINDPNLFTEAARNDPVIKAFLDAPFTVNYAQFKSSYRESEYFIHKPHKAMTGQVDGIHGSVQNMPAEPKISTLVLNHERTLAFRITRSLVVEDGAQAGQLIHKEGNGSS